MVRNLLLERWNATGEAHRSLSRSLSFVEVTKLPALLFPWGEQEGETYHGILRILSS